MHRYLDFKFILTKFGELVLPSVNSMANLRWFNQPFCSTPLGDYKCYFDLWSEAKINSFNNEAVLEFEQSCGFGVDRNWLNHLGFTTQVVIKDSPLNYAHGRVLYSALRRYIDTHTEEVRKFNIIETGTARGFSSLCIAKALEDANMDATIHTFDVLPHNVPMYWNCVSDAVRGIISRNQLLDDWVKLKERYIVFNQGYSKNLLPKIFIPRIHFAFLDGAHSYDDVIFEFNIVSKRQIKGDIIVFDDYTIDEFPGIVKAIDQIGQDFGYSLEKIIESNQNRGYVVATKK